MMQEQDEFPGGSTQRAQMARELLEHPLMKAAFRTLRATLARDALESDDLAEREKARGLWVLTRNLETLLQAHIADAALDAQRAARRQVT